MYSRVLQTQFEAIALAMGAMTPGHLVVLDIDETCLANVQNVRGHATAHPTANDDLIPECAAMFEAMRRAGLKHAFVSGRRERLRASTVRDLARAGIGDCEALHLCPDEYAGAMWEFKEGARRELHKKYAIAATVGDQLSDLVGDHTGQPFLVYNPYYRADALGVDVLCDQGSGTGDLSA